MHGYTSGTHEHSPTHTSPNTSAQVSTQLHASAHTYQHIRTSAHTNTSAHADTSARSHLPTTLQAQIGSTQLNIEDRSVYMELQTHISTYVCAHTETHQHIYVCAHRDTSGRVCVHTQTHINIYVCAHRHTSARMCARTQAHISTYTCVHTHVCTQQLRLHGRGCTQRARARVGADGHAERGRRAHPGHRAMPAAPGSPPSLPHPRPLRRHRRDVGSQKIISFPDWPRGSGNMKLPSSQPISKTLDTSVSASEFF